MSRLNIISFLGNIEYKLRRSRHNVGYIIYDELYKICDKKLHCQVCIDIKSLLFRFDIKYWFVMCSAYNHNLMIKPYIGMNKSGDFLASVNLALKSFDDKYNFVIYDEVDLSFPITRIKIDSKSSTHNGIRSLLLNLGGNFVRVKIGIGPNNMPDLCTYVLSDFSEYEINTLKTLTIHYFKPFTEWLLINTDLKELQKHFNDMFASKIIKML